MIYNTQERQGGYIMLTALVMGVVLSMFGVIATQLLINNARAVRFDERQSQALSVAEAGVNYYLWHLAHNPTDYGDGNNVSGNGPFGPYRHDYRDNDGDVIGTFDITVTPPVGGSTITTVKSVGKVPGLNSGRTILAQLGQPSFSNYIFLSNTQMSFSSTSTTTGPVHSNVGIEFNGTSNGPVTAARTSYTAASDGRTHTGVWGSGGPQSQWQYPVPAIDFNKVTVDLAGLRDKANAGGVNLGSAGSGFIGWYLELKSGTPASFDVYKVKTASDTSFVKTLVRTQAAPANGIVFSSDNVWIAGTGYPGRLTVAAAVLPDNASTRRNIYLVGNLTYASGDGSAALGLVAQNDIFIPGATYVPDDLTINAALLAQYGSVGTDTSDGPARDSFTLYGAIAQNQNNYGFKTTVCSTNPGSSSCHGFPATNYNFDSHLIYAPPPSFPTTGNYSVLNWREQLFNP